MSPLGYVLDSKYLQLSFIGIDSGYSAPGHFGDAATLTNPSFGAALSVTSEEAVSCSAMAGNQSGASPRSFRSLPRDAPRRVRNNELDPHTIVLGGSVASDPQPQVPWHPDTTELSSRIVRRTVRSPERLGLGSGDLLSEPVLVAMRNPGKVGGYTVTDAFGRTLATTTFRRPRFRNNEDFGARAVTIAPATGGILALKLAQGEWRLKGVQGGNLSIAAEIPEDLVDMAIGVFHYQGEDGELARRVILPEELAIATKRFFAPVTDSVEVGGHPVAVIQSGFTAPVRSPKYPGFADGAPWRLLARLRPVSSPLAELILADWLSPAHGP